MNKNWTNKILSIKIDDEKLNKILLYLLAFFIPAIALILIFLWLKVYPFGQNTYLAVDAYGQYVNYLQYFRNLLFGNSSMFYSLSKSIGGEMYGLFAYYLMSPYNLIAFFFEKGNMTFVFEIILILKMSTCGLTFAYYLNRRKKADFKNLIFSISYALSAYVITYGFNIMWLDSVILLPLVIAGIDDIVKDKKFTIYTIALSLTLITNYYMGFMVCVFSAIYFVYKLLLEELKPSKELIKKIAIFALFSIVAVLISSVILIPVFKGLQNGRADFSFSNINFDTNFNIKNLISKFFTNSFNLEEIKNDAMPPLFCGVLMNILVILYFINSKIKLKEKVLSFIMIGIFIISFYINGINLLWMMGNTPAWYIYRYAFTFSFIYIIIAKRSFENLREGIQIWKIIVTVCIYEAIAIIVSMQNFEFLNKNSIKMDMLLAFIFGVLLSLSKLKLKESQNKSIKFIKKYYMQTIVFAIFILSTINMINNASYSMDIIKKETSLVKQDEYSILTNTYNGVFNHLKEYDSSLYRIEKEKEISINDSLTFGYNGIDYSGSTYSKVLHTFLGKLGFEQSHVYVKSNVQNTKMTDMFLGIKYIVDLKDTGIVKEYEKEYRKEPFTVYKNPYALSMGFSVDKNIFNTKTDTLNTFEFQNEILKNMTKIEEDVYISQKGEIKNTLEGLSKNLITYNKEDESAKLIYEFEVESDKNLYVYIVANSIKNAEIYVNGEMLGTYFTGWNNEMINLGKREIGENIKIELLLKDEQISINSFYVYYEDEEILSKHYEELSKEQVELKRINNRSYIGKVNIQSDNEYVLFSIPYENGWEIKVDGEKVEYEEALDALIAVKISQGEHKVTLEYTPDGIYLGIIMSILGIAIFAIAMIVSRKK